MNISDWLRLVSLATGIAAILYSRKERKQEEAVWRNAGADNPEMGTVADADFQRDRNGSPDDAA